MSSADSRERSRTSVRRRWLLALTVGFVWHLGVAGVLEFWQPWRAQEVEARDFEPLDIVFAPTAKPTAEEEESDGPRQFTELPEDRADLEPEDPDFLSNVDSRARDQATEGEHTDLPRLEGESEAPQIAMAPPLDAPNEGSGDPEAQSATGDPQSDDATDVITGRAEGNFPTPADGSRGDSPGADESNRLREQSQGRQGRIGEEEDRSGFTPDSAPPRYRVGAALSDIVQEEMDHRQGNVPLMGDVTMNTQAWPWAPWLQRFRRDFLRGWINFVPYAYHIGVVDGRQVVELEIAPDGRLLHMEVVEREGHHSLEEATLANFRSFAPYQPLSPNGSFPEETLRMRITVIYPDR